ncbi:hypothetical protein LMG9673_02715 [Ralstonia pseudosolanacearum]|nr:hypothetical protein LMG9673_02715 [Ralstonia pseudosolanacearum]
MTSASTASGVNLPSAPAAVSSLEPLEKNSGPPHSSVSMCASSWQMTEWYDWHSADSASELAAVPLKTKKTSQSVSNRSRMRSHTRCVQESSP